MITFIVALEKEAECLLSNFENLAKKLITKKTIYEGTLFGKDVALIISGIGKVNASMATQMAILRYKPDFVFNFGTAGGTNCSLNVGDFIQVDKCCQFDFDLRDIDDVPLGYIQDYDCVFFDCNKINTGLKKASLATSDRFTECKNDNDTILSLNCSLRDMEGCAIAQVCISNDIPLIIVKGVSDVFGNKSTSEQFKENLNAINVAFPKIIQQILNNL